jgi:ATP-binding cassette, subfamily B, bacterial
MPGGGGTAVESGVEVARAGDHWHLIARFVAPHRRAVAGLAALTLLAGLVPLSIPVLLGRFADAAITGATVRELFLIGLAIAAAGGVANAGELAVAWLGSKLAWTAANELRIDVARHAFRLGPTWFAGTSPGAVVDRVDGDATRLGDLLGIALVRLGAAVVTLLGVLVLVAVQDLRLGAALAVVLVVGGALQVRLRDLAVPAGSEFRARTGEVLGAAEERLRGAEELRSLGASSYAVDDLHRRSALTIAPSRTHVTRAIGLWTLTLATTVAGGLATLAGGILLQRAGTFTVGQVLLAFTATQLTRRPLEQLLGTLEQLQNAASGAARLVELLDTEPLVDFAGDRSLPDGALELRLEGASVRYPGSRDDALSAVDLHLRAGEHLGVVGPTGGGKTTLTRLLHRALDPSEGRVLAGGVDLRQVTEASLRHRVAVVPQEVQLLAASVRENVTLFGAVEGDDTAVLDAIERVGLGPWLGRADGGLDAIVGDEVGTSAGEAQLLALARVLLRDPGLVVLDEPTARLDAASAVAVTRALGVLLEGRTAVVVAHRLATLDHVDRIAVIRAGGIEEEGDRALLAAGRSRFAALLDAERGAS